MANFRYEAKDKDGKNVTGDLEAQDRQAVIDFLNKQGAYIISITPIKAKAGFAIMPKKKVSLEDLVVFSRQLATIIDAGVPLVGALDIIGDQIEKPVFKAIIKNIKIDIETGSSLSKALAKYPDVFSNLFVNMVVSGENSGTLDDILDRLATYLEKVSALNKKIQSALVYPALVSFMAVAITLFLILRVVPTFKSIFAGFGAKLPLPTLILITISDFLQKWFILAVGFIVGAFFVVTIYAKTESGRYKFDKLKLTLPIFGKLIRQVAIARFCRTLATLTKSGVPILSSLDIVGKTAGNKVIEKAVIEVRASIREGENIATPLAKSGVFTPMVVRMISVGEQTGKLEKMLSKVSDFYESEVDAAVNGLTSIIEPLIIAILGILIGSIVVAMFMPIFKMWQIIQV